MEYLIRTACEADIQALAEIFWSHINARPEYISHGELQMGVGVAASEDSDLPGVPAPDGREKWIRYVSGHISSDKSVVYVAVDSSGTIAGFSVADVEEDGDAPFGMVCDVLVREGVRGGGIGGELLQKSIDWLRSQNVNGIYLESGVANHAAHKFFEKRGFRHISEIYKLNDYEHKNY